MSFLRNGQTSPFRRALVSDSSGPQKVLVLNKDVAAGEVIYKEYPMLTSLDYDLQSAGTHCTHCLREIQPSLGSIPLISSAGTKSTFCSKPCQVASKTQWHSFLFTVDPPLPAVLEISQLPVSAEALEARTRWNVQRMFDALRANGRLRAVKELPLDWALWVSREKDDIEEAITACAQLCPSLEVWTSTPEYSFKWTAEELGGLFGKFEMLRVINLPMEREAEFHGDIDQYFGVLAASCSGLEEVKITFGLGGLAQYRNKHFVVERHGDEIGVKSVFVELAMGM